jgi:protein AbiQ
MSNLEFKIIDDDYLDFIRAIEEKTPYTHYGSEKMKPFFGVLFEVNGLCYVSQISSGKQKHAAMKQSKTFIKLKANGMQPHGF